MCHLYKIKYYENSECAPHTAIMSPYQFSFLSTPQRIRWFAVVFVIPTCLVAFGRRCRRRLWIKSLHVKSSSREWWLLLLRRCCLADPPAKQLITCKVVGATHRFLFYLHIIKFSGPHVCTRSRERGWVRWDDLAAGWWVIKAGAAKEESVGSDLFIFKLIWSWAKCV